MATAADANVLDAIAEDEDLLEAARAAMLRCGGHFSAAGGGTGSPRPRLTRGRG